MGQPAYTENIAIAAPAASQPVGQYQPPSAYGAPAPVTYVVPAQQVVVPVRMAPGLMESNRVRWQLHPQRCICVMCKAEITTRVRPAVGLFNHVAACFCCFVGCWFGCCLIPYMMDGLSDMEHYCPSCNIQIGRCPRA